MQKKEYRRNTFYMFSLTLTLLFVYLGCHRDDVIDPLPLNKTIKTVRKADALNYMNTQFVMARNTNDTYITHLSDSVVYNTLINSDEHMATIAVQTTFTQAYSRIMLLEINDTIQTAVYSMFSSNNFSSQTFYGDVLITDLDGNMLNALKVENDYFVAQYVFPETQTSTSDASRSGGCPDCPEFADCTMCGELDEVVLMSSPSIKVTFIFLGGTPISINPVADPELGLGSGGTTNLNADCPTGYVKDDNNNCVPEPTFDPCAEIKQQLENANHQAKVNFLKTKTGDTIEHGFKQLKTGPFASLPTTNSGHSLDFGNLTNAVGYIHTHTDLYFTGRYDDDNNPEYKKGIKMFSPYDLRTFLLLVKNAQQDSSINVGDIYGTVITSSGNYTLKFTGNPNLINTDFNPKALKEKYEKSLKDYGKERGFLKFIKEVTNNNGVSLYQIKDNGTVKEIYLDENGKKQSENCD